MGRPSEGSGPVLIQGPCAALAARRPFCATLGHAGLMPALFLTIYYANPNLGSYSGAPCGALLGSERPLAHFGVLGRVGSKCVRAFSGGREGRGEGS